MDRVKAYISFRYPNWLDYARYVCKVQGIEDWAEDLLNDVICDLLTKPADKLTALLASETKKRVNGRPTTDLDKFVLKMLAINASSPVAPFRKNTVGNKVLSRAGGKISTARSIELRGTIDIEVEDYDTEAERTLDRLHDRNVQKMISNGARARHIAIYQRAKDGEPLTKIETATLKQIIRFLQSKRTLYE